MKALKEKRVSLRSLFRRSLVILSLLALAFAIGSCADTSGDSGGDTPPPPPPPPVVPVTPAVTLKTVQSVTVLSHPYLPSYEGAAPDLSGFKALVIFTDGTAYPVGGDSFAVYPPVAYVTDAFHHEIKFSAYNQYTILYKGDNAFPAAESTRANVYIPGVIALADYNVYDYATPGVNPDYIRLSEIDEVYEDQDISPGSLKLRANYLMPLFADTALAGTEPVDYVSDRWINGAGGGVRPRGQGENYDLWPTFTALDNPLTRQASNNPSVWRIDRLRRRAEYLITVPDPATNGSVDSITGVQTDFLVIPAIINTFYEVDRFEYDPSIGSDFRYIKLTADDTMKDYEWWWKVFNYADLRFNVTYFDRAAPNDPTKKPVRQIGVNEYTRAMYTVGADGNAKATVPMLTGYTNQEPAYTAQQTAKGLEPSNILSSVVLDYPLSAQLFYYDRLIKGPPGQGKVNLDDLAYTLSWSEEYLQPNVAIVPITDNNIIFLYDRLEVSRRDNTNHPLETEGYPYVVSTKIPAPATGAPAAGSYLDYLEYSARNVFKMLKRYWKAEWVYINDNRPGEECRFEIKPDETPDLWKNGEYKINIAGVSTDYDFSATEEIDYRDVTLTFKAPPSTASRMIGATVNGVWVEGVDTWAAWTARDEDGEFGYVMLP